MKGVISRIREKLGHDKFIHPAARIIVENESGEVLFIERIDNGNLGLPAGGLEEDETIEECIVREVREETGIQIVDLEVIGIASNPKNESVVYSNGDKIQYFSVEFFSNSWKGEINIGDGEEVRWAKFKSKEYLKELPINEQSTILSLEYYRKHNKIRLS